ncbi:MAG: phage tail tape measure protein [Thermosynechococcaceae cyanobacterium MS004]|nr:phage tail tape measure protein [Thermosynechococcaceae cyanobacterium MS004]
MTTRTLGVKFGTEGFQQAINEIRRTATAFDEALAKAQKRVDAANRIYASALKSGVGVEDAATERAKAARQANQIIQNSYRQLRIKSEEDLKQQEAQYIAAYNAIRAAGVGSANDVDRANAALRKNLGDISAQLASRAGKSGEWGQNLTQSVERARQAIKQADAQLTQSIRLEQAAIAATQKRAAAIKQLALEERAAAAAKLTANAKLSQAEAKLSAAQTKARNLEIEWNDQVRAALIQEQKVINELVALQGRLEAAIKEKAATNVQGAKAEEQAYDREIESLERLIKLQEKAALDAGAKYDALRQSPPIDLTKRREEKAVSQEYDDLDRLYEQTEPQRDFAERQRERARQRGDRAGMLAADREIDAIDAARKALLEAIERNLDKANRLSVTEPADLGKKRLEREYLDEEARATRALIELDKALARAQQARSKSNVAGAEAEAAVHEKEMDRLEALIAKEKEAAAAAKARLELLNQRYDPLRADAEKNAQAATQQAADARTRAAAQVEAATKRVESAAGAAAKAEADAAQKSVAAQTSRADQVKAIAARERATWQKERASGQAFERLGVRPEAAINHEKAQLIDAYRAIRAAGVASAKDIANAQQALNKRTRELNLEASRGARAWAEFGGGIKDAGLEMLSYVGQSAQFTIVFGLINQLSQLINSALTFPFAAARSWADFERQIKSIQVAAGGGNIDGLREQIQALAPELGKMPQDVAALALELTRAGYSSDQVSRLLRGVGFSAQATGEELSVVGTITSAVIKGFGVASTDYGRVSDILTAGANESAAGIASLGESLKYVGPNAKLADQSLEDTVTLLAALTDTGLQGSIAGTSLSQALQRIKIASAGASTETVVTTRGMKTATEAIAELGVQFRYADGSLRPVLEVLPELRKALNGVSKEDRDVLTKVLFGEEGGRAINALLVQSDEKLQDLNKTIKESGGAAEASGKQILGTFSGALQSLQARVENFKINLGEAQAPGLQRLVTVGGDLVERLLRVDGLFAEVNAASFEFASYLERNPALVDALDAQLQELVRTLLSEAVVLSKEMLEYFEKNPGALLKAVKAAENFFKILFKISQISAKLFGPILDEIDRTLSYTESVYDLVTKPLNPNSWLNALMQLSKNPQIISPIYGQLLRPVQFIRPALGLVDKTKKDPLLKSSEEASKAASDSAWATEVLGVLGVPLPAALQQSPAQVLSKLGGLSQSALDEAGGKQIPPIDPDAGATTVKGADFIGIQGRTGLKNNSQAHVHFEGSREAMASFVANANKMGLKVFSSSGKEIKGPGDIEPHWDGKAGATDFFLEGAPFDRTNTKVPVPNPFQGAATVKDISSGGRGGTEVLVTEKATGQTALMSHFDSLNFKGSTELSGADEGDRQKALSDLYNSAVDRERKILEESRQRADDYRSQQNSIQMQRLEDQQLRERLRQEQAIAAEPEGGRRAGMEVIYQATLKEQEYAKKTLELDQAIAQLIDERQRKVQDQAAGLPVSGRDYTSEINFLRQRKSELAANEFAEKKILQLNFEQELAKDSKALQEQLIEVNKIFSELQGKYGDQSAENDEATAVRELNQEFLDYKITLEGAAKALKDVIDKKSQLGRSTEEEMKLTQLLGDRYLELEAIQKRQQARVVQESRFAAQQRRLDFRQSGADLDSQLTEARATALDNRGDTFGADRLRQQDAIAQEKLRFDQQMLDLEQRLTTARSNFVNAITGGADINRLLELQSQVEALEQMKQKAVELNTVNLQNIKAQFKGLGEVIKGELQQSLEGFFTDVFTGTKSVEDAFRDMVVGILKMLAQLAAKKLASSIIGLIFGGGAGKGLLGFAEGGPVKFASGGPVRGAGTGTSDSILARVSNGEYIFDADSVDYWGENTLRAMQKDRMPPVGLLPEGRRDRDGGGRNIVVNQTTTVMTPDANSFRATEYQRSRDQAEMVRRALARG